jgi:hypothetical protein
VGETLHGLAKRAMTFAQLAPAKSVLKAALGLPVTGEIFWESSVSR